jgi:hypothetical protein
MFKDSCNKFSKHGDECIWRSMRMKMSINVFCQLLGLPNFTYHKEVAEDALYDKVGYYEDTTRMVDEKYVNVSYNDFASNETIIIESGTGSGKTTNTSRLINEYMKKTSDTSTVLSIVNLISLAEQQRITFAKAGIDLKMYNDKQVNPSILIAMDSCICINSLWKLHDCNFRNKIVYIDEINNLALTRIFRPSTFFKFESESRTPSHASSTQDSGVLINF